MCCVEGIGYGHLVMKFYDFSYVLIEVWAVFYLMFSFRWPLPWATCENPWNTGPGQIAWICFSILDHV